MKWLELTKNKAQKKYDDFYNKFSKGLKEEQLIGLDLNKEYEELRKDVLAEVKSVLNELNTSIDNISKLAYEFDYRFALKLYFLLNNKYGFNNYLANNDNLWIYMSVNVFPDLLYYRWGNSIDHIYNRSARLWLKSLWLYISLAWKNSENLTIKVLKNNNSDTLVQLVERAGKNGYRVELYKEILYKRSIYGIEKINTEVFRKIMTINTARIKVVDPYLVTGGIQSYVEELYEEALMGE